MTFRLVDETANAERRRRRRRRAWTSCRCRTTRTQKIAVRRRIDVDGGDLTDARAGTNPQTGEWVVNFTFNSRRRTAVRRYHAGERQPPLRHRAGRQGDQRAGDPRADHRRARSDQRQLHRGVGHRPRGAAARRRAAGAADRGGGAQRRAGTGRRQHPRRGDLARGRLRAGHRLHGACSMACSAGSRTSAWW